MSKSFSISGICFPILVSVGIAFALPSKANLLKMMVPSKNQTSFPYSANVTTKVFMNNQTLKDSGKIFSQPPDCMQVSMLRANTSQSSCGDTTWIRTSNGTISRSIGEMDGTAMGLPAGTLPKFVGSSKPDTNSLTISHSDIQNCVKVSLDEKEGQVSLEVDTLKKVVIKVLVQAQGIPAIETGFSYELFGKEWLPKEIRTSLPGGFLVLAYSEYKKEKKRSRKSFRLL